MTGSSVPFSRRFSISNIEYQRFTNACFPRDGFGVSRIESYFARVSGALHHGRLSISKDSKDSTIWRDKKSVDVERKSVKNGAPPRVSIEKQKERKREREREREIGEPRIHSVWKRLVETRIDDGPAAVREIDCRPLGWLGGWAFVATWAFAPKNRRSRRWYIWIPFMVMPCLCVDSRRRFRTRESMQIRS